MSLNYTVLNKKKTINSFYLNDRIYNLLNETFTLPVKGFSFNLFKVSKDYIARPDLISLDAYNDTQHADIICKINGISNPFELNEGMELIIPAAQYINYFYNDPIYDINELVDEEELDYKLPIEKKKSNKRKANEAIVGDTRFKVDASAGIIIY